MTQATKHFKNCLGVFQGGGCKALAFVGAFKEAIARGVFFQVLRVRPQARLLRP